MKLYFISHDGYPNRNALPKITSHYAKHYNLHQHYSLSTLCPFQTPEAYFAANLLFALNFSPKKNNTYTPTLHPTVNPANSVIPLFTPKLWKSG